jgi:DNA excision repair protein ERCC-2
MDRPLPLFSINVTDLVAFCLASGDLPRFSFALSRSPDPIQIHQMIEDSRGPHYQKEVAIERTFSLADRLVRVSGRMDGLEIKPGKLPVIEEIKTTEKSVADCGDWKIPAHWGQLKLYGYLYALQNQLSHVGLRLTYYSYPSRQTLETTEIAEFSELEDFVSPILHEYVDWLKQIESHQNGRNLALKEARFPFAQAREGQDQIVQAVGEAIAAGRQLLVQAPTGIGKTMAAMFAGLKSMSSQAASKIIFLTARTTGRFPALMAIRQMQACGIPLRVLVVTAKNKACFCKRPERKASENECPYAMGFYDRLKEARRKALTESVWTFEWIEEVAWQHQICPFEYSLNLLPWTDVVICDYNYIFDPRVGFKTVFSSDSNQALIVDEAHNLIDRTKEMYSASLLKSNFVALKQTLPCHEKKLSLRLQKINRYMFSVRREMKAKGESIRVADTTPEELLLLLQDYSVLCRIWLAQNPAAQGQETLIDNYFQITDFVNKAVNTGREYSVIFSRRGKELEIKLFCIDPAAMVAATLASYKSAIFCSATLKPFDYFKRVVGCAEEARSLEVDSPFPAENLRVIVHCGISTRFHDRERSLASLVHALIKFSQAIDGNTLAYFPSQTYLQSATELLAREYPKQVVVVQKELMSEIERRDFLRQFSNAQNKHLGLVVLGGIFGEAIDFPLNSLSGVVIVSLGLPGISKERELISRYFDGLGQDGYGYAFRYPGINKVLQAVGRIIRSASDKGTALLLDDRFSLPVNSNLFPEHWNLQRVHHSAQIASRIKGETFVKKKTLVDFDDYFNFI